MNVVHVTWYETHEVVDKNGKTWKFDVHPYYGAPSVLRKDGKDRKRQPGTKSPFWEAFTEWYDSYKRGNR
jgi:hypothetical protein